MKFLLSLETPICSTIQVQMYYASVCSSTITHFVYHKQVRLTGNSQKRSSQLIALDTTLTIF